MEWKKRGNLNFPGLLLSGTDFVQRSSLFLASPRERGPTPSSKDRQWPGSGHQHLASLRWLMALWLQGAVAVGSCSPLQTIALINVLLSQWITLWGSGREKEGSPSSVGTGSSRCLNIKEDFLVMGCFFSFANYTHIYSQKKRQTESQQSFWAGAVPRLAPPLSGASHTGMTGPACLVLGLSALSLAAQIWRSRRTGRSAGGTGST